MYAYYTGYVPDLKLHSDNIVDIQYTEVSNYGLVCSKFFTFLVFLFIINAEFWIHFFAPQ